MRSAPGADLPGTPAKPVAPRRGRVAKPAAPTEAKAPSAAKAPRARTAAGAAKATAEATAKVTPNTAAKATPKATPKVKPKVAAKSATATAPGRRRGRAHYHVYVIELSAAVLDHARFVRCNPNYMAGKPCVYVGMTGLDPDLRFDKHKAGIQSNRYVMRYGQRLLPDLYEGFNPMRYDAAVAREIEIGIDLRSAGWGVWQA